MRHAIAPPPIEVAAPPLDPGLDEAARSFFPDATAVTRVAGGDHLVRVDTPAGAWGVRRWPATALAERLAFIHAVLRHARGAGIDAVPSVAALPPPRHETVLTVGGRRYDAQTWLPGRPHGRGLAVQAPTGERVNVPGPLTPLLSSALVETIASIHEATVGIPRGGAPVVSLEGVFGAVQRAWGAHRDRLRPVAGTTPPIQRWLRVGERALPAARAAFQGAPELWQESPIVGHHDLWPAHALVAPGGEPAGPERLSGLVDWERAAYASPLLDLAQLVTHFAGWSADAAEAVLSAYVAVRPLAPEARRLLPAVAALDLVAEAGWLLSIAYASRPLNEPPLPEAVRAGAEALVASLEAVAAVLERGDKPAKGATRTWNHRRPKPDGSAPRADAAPGGDDRRTSRRPRNRPPKPPAGPRRSRRPAPDEERVRPA